MSTINGLDANIGEMNLDNFANVQLKLDYLKSNIISQHDKVTISNAFKDVSQVNIDEKDDPNLVLKKISNMNAGQESFVDAHSGLSLDRVLQLLDFE